MGKTQEELEKKVEETLDSLFAPKIEETQLIKRKKLSETMIDKTDHQLEVLIGSLLTLEWEVVPEIIQKALDICKFLQQETMDPLKLKLIKDTIELLIDLSYPQKISSAKLKALKKIAEILYAYHFEKKDVKKDLEDLNKILENIKVETVEEKKPEKIIPKISKILENLDFLIKEYQRLIAIQIFIKENRITSAEKIIENSKKEILNILESINPQYSKNLKKREEATVIFLQKELEKEKKKFDVFIQDAYLCEDADRFLIVPAEEVCFTGVILDNWREYFHKNYFPLKALKDLAGTSWISKFFAKIRNYLHGELAQYKEKDLKDLKIPVGKPLDLETQMLIIWSNGKGLVWPIKDILYKNLNTKLSCELTEKPFKGKARLNDKVFYILTIKDL